MHSIYSRILYILCILCVLYVFNRFHVCYIFMYFISYMFCIFYLFLLLFFLRTVLQADLLHDVVHGGSYTWSSIHRDNPNVLQALSKLINGQKKSRDLFLLFLRDLLQVEDLFGISFVNHFLRLLLHFCFNFLPVKLSSAQCI